MAWCRVGLLFTLIFLLHHYVGHIEARPQLNSTQQNVAGDVTSDEGETPATTRTEVKKNDEPEEAGKSEDAGTKRRVQGVLETLKTMKKLLEEYERISNKEKFEVDYKGCKMDIILNKPEKKIRLDFDEGDEKNAAKCTQAALLNIAEFIDFFLSDSDQKNEEKGTELAKMMQAFTLQKVVFDQDTKEANFKAELSQDLHILGNKLNIKKGSSMQLQFRYGMPAKKFRYNDLKFEIKGQLVVQGSAKIKYNINKDFDTSEGEFSLNLGGKDKDEITVQELFDAFGTKPDEDSKDEDEGDKSSFYSIKLSDLEAKGVVDINDESKFFITAKASNIPGLSDIELSGAFFFQRTTRKTQFGLTLKVNGLQPMTLLKYLVKTLPEDKLNNIPFLKDAEIDAELTAANSDIGIPKVGVDIDMKKPLNAKDVDSVSAGVKITFTLPLKKLLKKQGIDAKPGTVDPYVEIEITRKGLKVNFPDKSEVLGKRQDIGGNALDLQYILIVCAPQVKEWAMNNVLNKIPKVKVNAFEFDFKEKTFNFKFAAAETITFGENNMFSVTDAAIEAERKADGQMLFMLDSTMEFAGGTFKVGVSYKEKNWKIKGSIKDVSSTEVMKKLMGSDYQPSDYVFTVKDASLDAQIGTPMSLKVQGGIDYNGWDGQTEFSIANSDGKKQWAAGLFIENKGFTDIVEKLGKTTGASTAVAWMTKVNLALMVISDRSANFERKVFKDLLADQKKEGDLPQSGLAIIFEADVEVPSDCGEDDVCRFLQEKVGLEKLELRGVIGRSQFMLKFGIKTDIYLKDEGTQIILQSVKMFLKVGVTTEFGLESRVAIKMKDANTKEEQTVNMKGTISFSALSVLRLSLEIDQWKKPFGISFLTIKLYKMSAGIQFPTFIPTELGMEGTFELGKNSEIVATLGGGYNVGSETSFFAYAVLSDFSIGKVIQAFEWESVQGLPQAWKDITFNGVKAGVSLPTGRTIQIPDSDELKMSSGFFLQGEVIVLGYSAKVEIELKIPERFYLKGEFSPLYFANEMICLTRVNGRDDQGPIIEIELAPKDRKFKFYLNAAVEIFMFKAEAVISISNEGIDFWVQGTFARIFQSTVHLVAPFGGGSSGKKTTDLKASEDNGGGARKWKFSMCLRTLESKNAIKEASEEKLKEGEKVYKDADCEKKRNDKLKNRTPPRHYHCYWVAGKGQGAPADVRPSGIRSPDDCFKFCAKSKVDDDDINGVSMLQNSDGVPTTCTCERYMSGISPDSEYKTCYLQPSAFETDDTSKIGRSNWGRWNNYIHCPSRKRMKGFKLQVDWTSGLTSDQTVLNGIQFKCEKLYPEEKAYQITGGRGGDHTTSGVMWWHWGDVSDKWTECRGENNFIEHLSLQSMAPRTGRDDWAAMNLKAKCTDGSVVKGHSLESDSDTVAWSSWSAMDCPRGKFLCGARAKLERDKSGTDLTALNKLQSACCDLDEAPARPIYECKLMSGRIQKFDGYDRDSGDKWRKWSYGHHAMYVSDPEKNCPKECMKMKLFDDAINSIMIRQPGNTDTDDTDVGNNCLCMRDGGVLKQTNGGWKACFLVPATSWITSSQNTIDNWNIKLKETEDKLKSEIEKMEIGKKDMDAKCVKDCAHARTPVGGFSTRQDTLGGVKVNVPVWDANLNWRDNPWCLADCATGGLAIWNKIKGGFELIWFKFYEYKLYAAVKVQAALFEMVKYAADIYETIQSAESLGKGLLAAGSKVIGDAKDFVMKNILFIEELCASAGMDDYSNSDFCFKANGTLYLGGKSEGKDPTQFKDKKLCVSDLASAAFWKDLGKQLLEVIFPDMKEIFSTAKDIKDVASKQFTKEKQLASKRTDADKNGKSFDTFTKEDAEKKPDIPYHPKVASYRKQYDDILSSMEDDYVVRDDELVQAFRNIYDDDEDDDGDDAQGQPGQTAAPAQNGITFDPATLTNASGVHICKRTADLVNVYAGSAESFNFLLSKGEEAKKGYEGYLSGEANRFIGMEAGIRNSSIEFGLDEDEEDDAMFFVNKAKQGIAKRKDRLTQKYDIIDKSNLQTWRNYVGEVTSQKQMDVASFLDALSSASKETAKRMEVPDKKLERTLGKAEKIMRGLLGNDEATLSSKKSSIGELTNAANAIREVAKKHKCFENGLTE